MPKLPENPGTFDNSKNNPSNESSGSDKDSKSGGSSLMDGKNPKGIATNAAKNAVGENETAQKAAEMVDKAKDLNNKLQATINVVRTVIQGLISVFGNPYTYILLAIILLFIGLFAMVQVTGKNETACATSADDSGGNLDLSASKDAKKNANMIGTWLMKTKFKFNDDKPFTKEQMAGVMGNMFAESGWMPSTTQGHFNDKISNDDALALGKGNSGKAFGLIQWDASNRYALVEYAKSKNKPWQDLGIQLEFWKQWWEKDSYEASMAKKALGVSDKTPSGYAFAWNDFVERSASRNNHNDPNAKARAATAEQFFKDFKPTADVPDSSGSGDDSGSAACGGDDSFDNSSIVKLAISLAWPRDQREASLTHGDAVGKDKATPAYIAAKAKAESMTDKDPQGLFASCDRFAATVIRNTVDKKFPWGPTGLQHDYVSKHPELWKKITTHADLKPGDVLLTDVDGHVAIYLGKYQGIESVANASYTEHTGLVQSYYMNYNGMDLTDFGEGRIRKYSGWRYIGPGAESGGGDIAGVAETASPSPKDTKKK